MTQTDSEADLEAVERVLDGEDRFALLCGDWRTFDFADGVVEHTITDPPYDERTHERARSMKDGGSDIDIDFEPLSDFSFVADLLRVSRRWVLAFCALEHLGEYKNVAGEERWARSGIWHRTDGTPQLSGDRPAQAAEGIAIMHRTGVKKRWNSGGKRGMWRHGVERHERVHPTQKPLSLMLELIADFTEPGDVVFDPYAGSATTGVACLRLGRRFLGCERAPHHWRDALERLRAETRGLTLSAARAGQTSIFDMVKK